MGDCLYCKKPAGLFRSQHPDCKTLNQQGKAKITTETVTAIINGATTFDNLTTALEKIASTSFIPASELKAQMAIGFDAAVEKFLDDDLIDKDEETKLALFQAHFELTQHDLNQRGALSKVVKSAVLREVCSGNIPSKFSQDGLPAINYQKNEQVVWAFKNSQFLEDKTRREFVGTSHGVSIRIAKGVYYRTGAFKGRPVQHTERVLIDSGWVVVTDKHIYFSGSRKSSRFPYQKIISFEPYSNGIGIMRDAATAKPQIFITNDGWFTYNLITNLAKL